MIEARVAVKALEGCRELVPVDGTRRRFRAVAKALGWTEEALAQRVATELGWGRDEKATRGVLVLIGWELDRWGARRERMRAYRAWQLRAILAAIVAGEA